MAGPDKTRAVYSDLEAVPPHLVAEIVDGALFSRSHGHAAPAIVRTMLIYLLRDFTQQRSNPDAIWQVVTLPELHLGHDVLVPELAAWSVERMPFLTNEHSSLPPDWVCELISKDSLRNPAFCRKLEIYCQLGVRYAWTIDLSARRLSVLENAGVGWLDLCAWSLEDQVRSPPFDAISFSLADLWPLDPPLGLNEDPTPYYAGDR